MTVTAKFRVQQIADTTVRMEAVVRDGENVDWSQWTPWGSIEMGITNPAALEQFEEGAEYTLTFERTGAPKAC